jgi:hypothetical protein
LGVATPRDVQQREDGVEQAPIFGTVITGAFLAEDLPGKGAVFVVLHIVRRPGRRIREGLVSPMHLGEALGIAGVLVVRVKALRQHPIYAIDGISRRVRTQLKSFVVIDERGFWHGFT